MRPEPALAGPRATKPCEGETSRPLSRPRGRPVLCRIESTSLRQGPPELLTRLSILAAEGVSGETRHLP